ncbi:aminoacyl tRNA synthase complex-interacting multifunctional protein 1-like [Tropilaelaps mercedesae]|uniref:Aminoacyl tRNA synthase complex-interacting multifunctional protein 1-like n=1 Tax=Tropilaelaps mercedesae TaxID=418985 RepID=A0A1V9XKP9_9ACAR|nr:aminoacyl tRNA synthase complex-interacting multifunctional protein 1-like [Tropilaelaps mercedesae]
MSAGREMAKLLSRSRAADILLIELSEKVARLRQRVAVLEAQRLRRENEDLTLQCEAWRQRLIRAEIANGKKQYSTPTCSVSNNVAGTSNLTLVDGDQPNTPAQMNISKEGTANDSKKTKKPAKESKSKEPAAAGKEAKAVKTDTKPEAASENVCVSQLDLRVGLIKQVDRHPDADALYVEQIDVGEEKPRTIISGLVKFVPLEEMQDRAVVVMCNLKPAKMRGILSEGMVMCASTLEKVEPIRPPKDALPGDRLTWTGLPVEGYPVHETVLNPKKKIWERIAPDLKVDEHGHMIWMDKPLEVRGKGRLSADTLRSVNVK